MEITADSRAARYGIELDAYRAEQAGQALHQVIQGNRFNAHCPAEPFSLLYLNPPYDFEVGESRNQRIHDLYFLPQFEDFQPRTMRSLSNAFTSAFKELDPIPRYKAPAKLAGFLESSRLS